jgi:hypothetical protein
MRENVRHGGGLENRLAFGSLLSIRLMGGLTISAARRPRSKYDPDFGNRARYPVSIRSIGLIMVPIIAKEGVDGLQSKVCEDCCAGYHFFEGPSPMVGASPV